ncbi:hypothetical protein CM1200mP19_1330 [bacterium]|nr:MAG: hypothetical protein CM1200mP19_1330 [bacterium]
MKPSVQKGVITSFRGDDFPLVQDLLERLNLLLAGICDE